MTNIGRFSKRCSPMLTLYAKNGAENIPAHVLKQIKDEIDG